MTTPGTSTAHAVSPDSGQHWTEPGAWPVAPGVHRIPLPLPMDGLRAVNVYVIETERRTDPDRRRLGDRGESRPARVVAAPRSAGRSADITPLPGHPRAPRPLHAGGHRPTGVRLAHRRLGLGDKPTLDLIHQPRPSRGTRTLTLLRRAGAHRIADDWAAFTVGSGARPDDLGLPRHLARGRPRPRGRHPDPRRGAHPRSHPGPLRLRRPRGRPAVRRRPRAADDHARRSASSRRRRRSRCGDFLALAGQGARPARPARCCPRTGRSPRRSHARVDELLAHHDAPARPVPGAVARRRPHGVRRRAASCRGPGTSSTSTTSTSSTPPWPRWRRWPTSSCWWRGELIAEDGPEGVVYSLRPVG